jgi:hypothetical protein
MVSMSNIIQSILFPPPVPKIPDCPAVLTEVPMSIFSSPKSYVYPLFCERWHADLDSRMTLDSAGQNTVPELQFGRKEVTRRKRTPPADVAAYLDWRFELGFTPSKEGGNCQADCNAAYDQISKSCASKDGKSLSLFSFNQYFVSDVLVR